MEQLIKKIEDFDMYYEMSDNSTYIGHYTEYQMKLQEEITRHKLTREMLKTDRCREVWDRYFV